MSLLSVDIVVEEDSEECFSSQAQPAREASTKAATQVKINVEGRMEVFVIFIKVTIRRKPTSPMGCTPHNVTRVFRYKHQAVKTVDGVNARHLTKRLVGGNEASWPDRCEWNFPEPFTM